MCNENYCRICPRACGANRKNGVGLCGVGKNFKIARAGLHLWEEPCISYGNGSGTVFFSGCPLHCVFCQNYEISDGKKGRTVTEDELEGIIFSLCEKGASNINLVSPTQFTEGLARLLCRIKAKIPVPIVYNTGGYDSVASLKMLSGLIDVYLPDVKYFSPQLSKRYSGAFHYFEKASCAVTEMLRQVGYGEISEADGGMRRGLIVRHLVLPSCRHDSMRVFDELAKLFEPSKLCVSIMRQYFPTGKSALFPEINRRITTLEYESVVSHALSLGFSRGFTQGKDSATNDFVPTFDF